VRNAHAVGAAQRFISRPPESYSDLEWIVRKGVRNVQWLRAEGLSRLVEEHDLHPLGRTAAAVEKARWRRAHPRPPGSATPVFLTGLPRSGTNMVARGLGTLPEVELRNEGDRAAFRRYRLRPDEVVRDVVARSGQGFVVFKPLLDIHRVPGLLTGLGSASPGKVLWAHRDVDGRVRSALSKFGPAARDALHEVAAGRAPAAWQAQGLSEHSLEVIRSVDWARAEPADGIALLWYVKNRLFFEHGLDGRPDVLLVSYGDLVGEPVETSRAVCRFLGAEWRESVCSHIDRRAAKRREPVVLQPRIRELCDELAARIEAAAATAGGPS
jgi:hypothetical protein